MFHEYHRGDGIRSTQRLVPSVVRDVNWVESLGNKADCTLPVNQGLSHTVKRPEYPFRGYWKLCEADAGGVADRIDDRRRTGYRPGFADALGPEGSFGIQCLDEIGSNLRHVGGRGHPVIQEVEIQGIAALGFTMNMPTEDRYLMTKEELLDTTCALLGGRAAEEIVFAQVTTGASNDLQKATQIAENMVKEYGMSDALGLVAHREERGQSQMLGMPNGDRSFSEDTARQIDAEVARIIAESYQRAKQVIADHREVLEKVVEVLFEKEIMEGDDLRRLLNAR